MSWHKEQLGFLTIASNTNEVDYLKLAYVQALSIKDTQKNNRFAVIVDENTNKYIEEKHRKVFDYIIPTEKSTTGPYGLEPKCFWLTPFKETIKVESDILFTTSIDHWLPLFRLQDLVLSYGCKNYLNEISTSRKYRKIFDDNNLPDVYNGLMYFRYNQTSADFFRLADRIFENWTAVSNVLLNCRDEIPTTDVVYGICAAVIGKEKCCIPSANFINFTHMKPAINHFEDDTEFDEVFVTEFNEGMIRINNINQLHPLHYNKKNFIDNKMLEYYERSR